MDDFDFNPLNYQDFDPGAGSGADPTFGASAAPSSSGAPSGPSAGDTAWERAMRTSPGDNFGSTTAAAAEDAAPSLMSRAASSAGNFAYRRLLPGAWLGAAYGGAAESAATPTEDMRATYGFDKSGGSLPSDVGVRALGTMVDVGNNFPFPGAGIPDRFNNLIRGNGFTRTPAPRSDISFSPDDQQRINALGSHPTDADFDRVRATYPRNSASPQAGADGNAPFYTLGRGVGGQSSSAPAHAAPAHSGQIAGISDLGHHIDHALVQAQTDPHGSEMNAQNIEQQTGSPIDHVFAQMMQRYNQPVNIGLSRQEKANLLMQFGFATMAAAARPGAKFGGAVGEGGMAAENAYNQMRSGHMQMAMHNQDMAQKTLTDWIANRRADISDKRADQRFSWEQGMLGMQQQRADQLARHQQAMEAEQQRWHEEQMPLLQGRTGYYDARAGAVGGSDPMHDAELDQKIIEAHPDAEGDVNTLNRYRQMYGAQPHQFGATAGSSSGAAGVVRGPNGQLYGPAP